MSLIADAPNRSDEQIFSTRNMHVGQPVKPHHPGIARIS
jgi:hypothetical protein